MPRIAANLTMLFAEHPVGQRFDAARAAGFEAVEKLFPYDHPAGDYARWIGDAGLSLVLVNTPPTGWASGARGHAAVPGASDAFRSDLATALAVADVLKPSHIHLMAGICSGSAARSTYVANLAWAAAQAPGQSFTIEPLNPHDMPGYFLDDFALAAEVIAEVGAPNLHLQFDAYHAARIEGDAAAAWTRYAPLTRHIQIASTPDRHEPDHGSTDYPALFAAFASAGYTGHIAAEYHPRGRTEAGLGWFHALGR